MSTKFSFPDLYRTNDTAFYNYIFKQDRLLRLMGKTINELEYVINKQDAVITQLKEKVGI